MEKNWDLITADVTAAFLNAELTGDEEIYLIPPKSEGLEGKLWKAEKAIYGLRRSPRDFYEHFGKKAAKYGWQRVAAEPQLLRNPKYKDALMSAHTDDLLITANQKDLKAIKKELDGMFEILMRVVLNPILT